MKRTKNQLCGIFKPSFHKILISEEAILCEDRTTEDERRSEYYDACVIVKNKPVSRYILEARKRALAKKKKLRTLGKRTRSVESEDEMEEDGKDSCQ